MKQFVTHTVGSFHLRGCPMLSRVLPARPVFTFDGETLTQWPFVCTENGRQVFFKCPKDAMAYQKQQESSINHI